MSERVPSSLLARRGGQIIVAGKRNPAMQRISDALRAGLTWYVQGDLPLTDAARLVSKFQEQFPPLTRDKRYASRRKMAGAPRYRLVVFANRPSAQALFWLMTDRPEDPREQWRDALGDPTTCYQWEAVRRTRTGAAQPSWTWAATREHFREAKARIRKAIRQGRPEDAVAFGAESRTWPGFAGVREQRAALLRVYTAEWARTRADKPPPWPRLSYVQRLKTA